MGLGLELDKPFGVLGIAGAGLYGESSLELFLRSETEVVDEVEVVLTLCALPAPTKAITPSKASLEFLWS
jgi:hypothetical protein